MKNPLNDSLFCGIISLQLAAFSFVYAPRWSDSISLTSLFNYWNRASIEVGHSFPDFPVYDQQGIKQSVLDTQGKESVVVFKGTCSCDENQISNWLDIAQKKGQSITLVVPLNTKEETQAAKHNGWKGRILRVRYAELEQLGLLKENAVKQLPLIAYLDASGKILGVRNS